MEPVGVRLALEEPAAAVTGRGPEASDDDVVADVVEVACELRAGAAPPDTTTNPTTTPVAPSTTLAMVAAVRPRTTDHSARGCTMAPA